MQVSEQMGTKSSSPRLGAVTEELGSGHRTMWQVGLSWIPRCLPELQAHGSKRGLLQKATSVTGTEMQSTGQPGSTELGRH